MTKQQGSTQLFGTCEEAAQKMKAPETMVAWSKLSGRADVVMRRADVVMREESRQHEGTVTWEVF